MVRILLPYATYQFQNPRLPKMTQLYYVKHCYILRASISKPAPLQHEPKLYDQYQTFLENMFCPLIVWSFYCLVNVWPEFFFAWYWPDFLLNCRVVSLRGFGGFSVVALIWISLQSKKPVFSILWTTRTAASLYCILFVFWWSLIFTVLWAAWLSPSECHGIVVEWHRGVTPSILGVAPESYWDWPALPWHRPCAVFSCYLTAA